MDVPKSRLGALDGVAEARTCDDDWAVAPDELVCEQARMWAKTLPDIHIAVQCLGCAARLSDDCRRDHGHGRAFRSEAGGGDPAVMPVIRAIADLARAYGLEVAVEGIEDGLALAGVDRLGCEYARGTTSGVPRQRPSWRSCCRDRYCRAAGSRRLKASVCTV
jgi:hypothetical protein